MRQQAQLGVSRGERWQRVLALVLGGLTCLLSLSVLLGWLIESPLLVQVSTEWAPTQPNTALGLGLCGLVVVGLVLGWRKVPLAGAALIFLLSGLSLLQYWTGSDLGIDTFWVNPFTRSQTAFAGRMSVETGLMFFLFSLTALALQVSAWKGQRDLIAACGGVLVAGFAGIGLLAYAVGATDARLGLGGYSRMGFLTSVGFLLSGAGILLGPSARTRTDRVIVPRWVPVALGTLAAVLALGGWWVVKMQTHQEIIYVTKQRLDLVGALVRNHMMATIQALERMVERSRALVPATEYEVWRADAQAYLQDEPAYLLIQWSEESREPWRVESTNLRKRLDVGWQESKQVVFAGSADAIQVDVSDADKLLKLQVPISRPGGANGAIQAVLDFEAFLSEDIKLSDNSDYFLRIRDRGSGWIEIGGTTGPLDSKLGASGSISILSEQLDFQLIPGKALIGRVSRSGVVIFFFAIAITTILLVGVSYLIRQLLLQRADLHDLQMAVEQACVVAITDEKGRITSVNKKFIEISQYSADELIGVTHRIINSGWHPPEFFAQMWATIKNGQIWRGEVKNRKKDGTMYWMDTTIVPFLNAIGRPFQFMTLRFDITKKKQSSRSSRN